MRLRTGDRAYFVGYDYLTLGSEEIFNVGQIVVIADVDGEGAYKCFAIDDAGRVISMKGDTLFEEELLRLPFPRIPQTRLPYPFGDGNNEIERPRDGTRPL